MKLYNLSSPNASEEGGVQPSILHAGAVPDGDAFPWEDAAVGSLCICKLTANHVEHWVKVANEGADTDWTRQFGYIGKYLTLADFTDGGSAAGTYTFTEQIPAEATVTKVFVRGVTAFAGDSTSVLIVGDGSTTNRYMTGTPSVQTATAGTLAMGVVSGTAYHSAAKAPVLTITEDDDFTDITTGALTFTIFYF